MLSKPASTPQYKFCNECFGHEGLPNPACEFVHHRQLLSRHAKPDEVLQKEALDQPALFHMKNSDEMASTRERTSVPIIDDWHSSVQQDSRENSTLYFKTAVINQKMKNCCYITKDFGSPRCIFCGDEFRKYNKTFDTSEEFSRAL